MKLRFVVVLALLPLIAGCYGAAMPETPARVLSGSALPRFSDDLELAGLQTALKRQIAAFRHEPNRSGIRVGDRRYRTDRLVVSAERFLRLVHTTRRCLGRQPDSGRRRACYDRFNRRIRAEFDVIELPSPQFTAYYTPTIEVSTKRSAVYRYPIYRAPDSSRERHLTRVQIDFDGALRGRGVALVYARDRFNLYVLQIEGGGRLLVHDGDRRYYRYAIYRSDNGKPFRDIDEYMVEHGMLSPRHRSRHDQRRYLEDHPERAREIYAYCPGYVFFRIADTPPVGSSGAELTPGRSLASDPDYYPVKGAIAYVVTRMPKMPLPGTPLDSNPQVPHRTMRRFFIDQDTGHSISGPARADLFLGDGPDAEFLANNLQSGGRLYLLISK